MVRIPWVRMHCTDSGWLCLTKLICHASVPLFLVCHLQLWPAMGPQEAGFTRETHHPPLILLLNIKEAALAGGEKGLLA